MRGCTNRMLYVWLCGESFGLYDTLASLPLTRLTKRLRRMFNACPHFSIMSLDTSELRLHGLHRRYTRIQRVCSGSHPRAPFVPRAPFGMARRDRREGGRRHGWARWWRVERTSRQEGLGRIRSESEGFLGVSHGVDSPGSGKRRE